MIRIAISITLCFWAMVSQAALVGIDESEFSSTNIIYDNLDGPLNQNPVYTFGPGTVLYPANAAQLPRTGQNFVGPRRTANGDDRRITMTFGGGVDVFEIGAYYGNDDRNRFGEVDFWLLLWDKDDNYLGSNKVAGNLNDAIDQFLGARSDVPLGIAVFYMYDKIPGNISFVTLDDFRIGYETSLSSVPLPASLWFFATALIGLAGFHRRSKSV